MDEIVGVIYPVPPEFAGRLFVGKNNVFVKCTGRQSTRLKPGHKVIIYESQGPRKLGLQKLIGEGTVETAEFLSPETVLAIHGPNLFLNKYEFHKYVGRREVLTLKLKELKKYLKPINIKEQITMAGKYLTAEQYHSLVGDQK